jgi:ABC-type multidrug transport system ATPase subunit
MLNDESLPGKISLAAPYLELPEEFTLEEMLRFHFSIVPAKTGYLKEEMLKSAGLAGQEQKFIKHFSSGMKQRLKLLLAFYSNSPLLLLDEPCSNLDENGIKWYRRMLEENLGTRTIIIASNQSIEYEGCQTIINVSQFKT